MFSNHNNYNRNGHKRSTYSEYAVSDAAGRFYLPIHKRTDHTLETKLIIGALNGLGITAFIGGILLNIGDWKSAILFGLGALYALARFVVYCVKSWQDIRWREKHLRKKP